MDRDLAPAGDGAEGRVADVEASLSSRARVDRHAGSEQASGVDVAARALNGIEVVDDAGGDELAAALATEREVGLSDVVHGDTATRAQRDVREERRADRHHERHLRIEARVGLDDEGAPAHGREDVLHEVVVPVHDDARGPGSDVGDEPGADLDGIERGDAARVVDGMTAPRDAEDARGRTQGGEEENGRNEKGGDSHVATVGPRGAGRTRVPTERRIGPTGRYVGRATPGAFERRLSVMAPRAREGAIDWLLRPWLEGRGFGARAGRIAISAGVLTLLILPAMMLWFGPSGWWWDVTLVVSVTTPLGIIVADAIAELVRPGRLGLPRSVALFVGFVLGMLGGYVVIALVRSPLERPPDVLFRDFRRNVLIVGPVLLVVGGLVASLWYRAEAYRLESAAASARYAVLEGQLQPHFLFNALNALKELIADDPERAREFTQKLADLYRRILQTTTSRTTSLSDELAIVRQYLEVEQLRHGERLAWTLDHPPELAQRRVPALVVQTLVENAVKHGIAKSRAGGTVAVTAERAPGDALRLTVRNTGAPFRPGEGGRGLENTRARLLLMYGSESRFEIGAEDGATVATFVVGAHAKDAVS